MLKKKITNEDLAGMMKKGFDGVDEQLSGMEKRLNDRMDTLETGQEDIKLRLDQAAYRFELQALQKRVDVLEKNAGIPVNKISP